MRTLRYFYNSDNLEAKYPVRAGSARRAQFSGKVAGMADYDDSTLRGMLGGGQTRLGQVRHLLDVGDAIHTDAVSYCVAAPPPHRSDTHPGHLIVTGRQFVYVPDDEDPVVLSYAEVQAVAFLKQQRQWRIVEFRMKNGDLWAITVLPQSARIAKRWMKKANPEALSRDPTG
jgi:hypothetical protein